MIYDSLLRILGNLILVIASKPLIINIIPKISLNTKTLSKNTNESKAVITEPNIKMLVAVEAFVNFNAVYQELT